jgi:membrane protease YdiL (CAAX protease family)
MTEVFLGAMSARRIPHWLGAPRIAGVRHRGAALAGALRRRPGEERPAVAPFLGVLWAYLGAYLAVAALSAGLSLALARDPWACDGWLGARGWASFLLSLGLGVCLGAVTVAATRGIVQRSRWGRALHAALRPAVHGASDGALWALAIAGAAGEELLFRGLLVPTVGVIGSSVLFGALHQIRGSARWGWMAWATVMGLLFGMVFAATGSLAGPIIAHVAINHVNLRFLRDNDPDRRPRSLGGLLNR